VKSSLMKLEKKATAPASVPRDAATSGPVRVYQPMPREVAKESFRPTPGSSEAARPAARLPEMVEAVSKRVSFPREEIVPLVKLAPTSTETTKMKMISRYSTKAFRSDSVRPKLWTSAKEDRSPPRRERTRRKGIMYGFNPFCDPL